ncbi:MAG: flippase-like domain-containing protein [Candidatus Scalindua sp.]|nr:flippase-like domain-containing protein [Candidatus Scalindua sp.]
MLQLSGKQSTNETLPKQFQVATQPHRYGSLITGLIFLSGLVLAVTHFGEIEHFVKLMREAEPVWLVYGVLLQIATYFVIAGAWHQTLRYAGVRYSMLSLVPMGIAKLFSDQALPSGGMSGAAFFVTALSRRGISTQHCMAVMLVNLVAYYIAYFLAAIASVILLWFYHAIHVWIVVVAIVFSLVAVVIPIGALWISHRGKSQIPKLFMRIPGLTNMLDALGNAPDYLLRNPRLITEITLLQLTIFLLDSATLWCMLHAIGQNVSFLAAFPSFIIASMVATISPLPLGLGVFETACVLILGFLNVYNEAALTATLLLRGITMWLPMLPGMWLARRELR